MEEQTSEDVDTDAMSEVVEEEGACAVTPAGADFLVCYATTNGEYRVLYHKVTKNGSTFSTCLKKLYHFIIAASFKI